MDFKTEFLRISQATLLPSISRRRAIELMLALITTQMPFYNIFANKSKMNLKKIPSSGEKIPVLGLGTYGAFGASDAKSLQLLRQILESFVQQKGSLIDSSPMYGLSEQNIGKLAGQAGLENRLFYATKVWIRGKKAGIAQMKNSMRLMNTPVIDLMQVHNLVDTATHLATLRDWKEKGLIRYIGLTHYTVSGQKELEKWVKKEPLDFIQINYSIATTDAEKTLLPLCQKKGVAVLVNRPFEAGDIFSRVKSKRIPLWAKDIGCNSWGQFFLKYIVSHPTITCAIPATGKINHLLDNMHAGFGYMPSIKERIKMKKYFFSI